MAKPNAFDVDLLVKISGKLHAEDISSPKRRREKLPLKVNILDKVSEVRKQVARAISLPECDVDLVYRGKCMRDDEELRSYGVKPFVTLYALQKSGIDKNTVKPDEMESESLQLQQVANTLQKALTNSANCNTVEKLFHKSDMLETIVSATPGLASDPVALGILSAPEILSIMINPAQVKRVIELHPALGHAVMMVFAAINEEIANGDHTRERSSDTYSLDQMSDEEDAPAAQITASQLAAALAAADGSMATPPVLVTNNNDAGSSGRTRNDPAISTEFFRQAMAVASGQNDQATQNQLEQMRSMGISDESVARQALEAAGGDLQAALEIIFGSPNL